MVWYQTFDSLDILISAEVSPILRWVCFNEPVQEQKVESAITLSDYETTIKKRTGSSCVFTGSGKVRKGGER